MGYPLDGGRSEYNENKIIMIFIRDFFNFEIEFSSLNFYYFIGNKNKFGVMFSIHLAGSSVVLETQRQTFKMFGYLITLNSKFSDK